jgi:hypothetical protein
MDLSCGTPTARATHWTHWAGHRQAGAYRSWGCRGLGATLACAPKSGALGSGTVGRIEASAAGDLVDRLAFGQLVDPLVQAADGGRLGEEGAEVDLGLQQALQVSGE